MKFGEDSLFKARKCEKLQEQFCLHVNGITKTILKYLSMSDYCLLTKSVSFLRFQVAPLRKVVICLHQLPQTIMLCV